jgi:hypothetical protein
MIDPSLIMIVYASFLRFQWIFSWITLRSFRALQLGLLVLHWCLAELLQVLSLFSFPFVRIRQRLPKDWKCSTICVWPVTVLPLPSRLKLCRVLAVFSLPGFASASA